MPELAVNLMLPDAWQRDAVKRLREGQDVVIHAPTGAGKTYVFELFVEKGLNGQAIYTVPTRALANDKLLEWTTRGWDVGINTGDVAFNLNAPVVVATLETLKQPLLRGEGPALLVIDEYQMLSDPDRGANYETAIATAPEGTQLLLMSGSVGNPRRVVSWLERIGRNASLVKHDLRPVPQDELYLDSLRDEPPPSIRGALPRSIAKALMAGLGPILIFAPRRHAAEKIARQLASALPNHDALILTPEQKKLAGTELSKLLSRRIAYHHSGLSYSQRAGLIEPLAKTGQLRVMVATTGLGAGINFCMRSVMITDKLYRTAHVERELRPDELLQMFGRAGRRGLDERGFILVDHRTPKRSEARPLQLKRAINIDWPACLRLMSMAAEQGYDPVEAAEEFCSRLMTPPEGGLGLRELTGRPTQPDNRKHRSYTHHITQMQTSTGEWEALVAPVECKLSETLVFRDNKWRPALKIPRTLEKIPLGTPCRIGKGESWHYGRELVLATTSPKDPKRFVLTKQVLKLLRLFYRENFPEKRQPGRTWTLGEIRKQIVPHLPLMTGGGSAIELEQQGNRLRTQLDYREAPTFARPDSQGKLLLNPPQRKIATDHSTALDALESTHTSIASEHPARAWLKLGLIDEAGHPTRRGLVFACFNHGEGLAIAAALEDDNYAIEDLARDLPNLRAGHRFETWEGRGSALGAACRAISQGLHVPGYLYQGLPTNYGEGAAEVIAELAKQPGKLNSFLNEELLHGDLERIRLEWRSLLRMIKQAPVLDWQRWLDLQHEASSLLGNDDKRTALPEMPPLTNSQRTRYDSGPAKVDL